MAKVKQPYKSRASANRTTKHTSIVAAKAVTNGYIKTLSQLNEIGMADPITAPPIPVNSKAAMLMGKILGTAVPMTKKCSKCGAMGHSRNNCVYYLSGHRKFEGNMACLQPGEYGFCSLTAELNSSSHPGTETEDSQLASSIKKLMKLLWQQKKGMALLHLFLPFHPPHQAF